MRVCARRIRQATRNVHLNGERAFFFRSSRISRCESNALGAERVTAAVAPRALSSLAARLHCAASYLRMARDIYSLYVRFLWEEASRSFEAAIPLGSALLRPQHGRTTFTRGFNCRCSCFLTLYTRPILTRCFYRRTGTDKISYLTAKLRCRSLYAKFARVGLP